MSRSLSFTGVALPFENAGQNKEHDSSKPMPLPERDARDCAQNEFNRNIHDA